jgi:hypothetical protein
MPFFLEAELKAQRDNAKVREIFKKDPLVFFSPAAIIFASMLAVAVYVSFSMELSRSRTWIIRVLAALMATSLAAQMMIGMPMQRAIIMGISEQRRQELAPFVGEQLNQLRIQQALVADAILDIGYSVWFWLEFVCVGLAVVLDVVATFISRMPILRR